MEEEEEKIKELFAVEDQQQDFRSRVFSRFCEEGRDLGAAVHHPCIKYFSDPSCMLFLIWVDHRK